MDRLTRTDVWAKCFLAALGAGAASLGEAPGQVRVADLVYTAEKIADAAVGPMMERYRLERDFQEQARLVEKARRCAAARGAAEASRKAAGR